MIAAEAGERIAELGGNAVDVAIAALLVSLNTEPGIITVGSGAFATVWPAEGDPETIDGYAEMPGRGLADSRRGGGLREVTIDYGGGVTTFVGHGSVATPGTVAALWQLADQHGSVPWSVLFGPAIEHTARGFSMPPASYQYLHSAHEAIFGWHEPSYETIHDDSGSLLSVGDTVHVAHLAESLDAIAEDGADVLFGGEIGNLIASDIEAWDGLLTRQDLIDYQALSRRPLTVDFADWRVATNPPPAVGGIGVGALLAAAASRNWTSWDPGTLGEWMDIQEAVFSYRKGSLDASDDVGEDAAALLEAARLDTLASLREAPSTVNTAAVDSEGLACAITASSGYGSGVMPPGTGIWLNNSLGEVELNRTGLHALPTGRRLLSNMAPSVSRMNDGSVLAIGSPGADRITSALAQTMVNTMSLGMKLDEAVAFPRVHVEVDGGPARVAVEPGLGIETDREVRRFDDLDMFFGGVTAASWTPKEGLQAAADPRRTGGTAVT